MFATIRHVVAALAYVGVFSAAMVICGPLDKAVAGVFFDRWNPLAPFAAAVALVAAYVAVAAAIAYCTIERKRAGRRLAIAVAVCTLAGTAALVVEDVRAIAVPLATYDYGHRGDYVTSPVFLAWSAMDGNAAGVLAFTGLGQVVVTWGGGALAALVSRRRPRTAAA